MDDLISRQMAIEAMGEEPLVWDEYTDEWELAQRAMWRGHVKALKSLPAAKERKKGKWIERESGEEDKENGFHTVIVCDRCDFPATTFYSEDCESRTQIRTDFCPNCGAKMEMQ